MPKKQTPKKKLFHSRETATEKALRLYGTLDVKDVRNLSSYAKSILSEAVKEQRAQIRKKNPTSDFAKMSLRNTTTPQLLSIFLAQKSFIKEQEQIRQDIRDADFYYKTDIDSMSEFISDVSSVVDTKDIEVLKDSDKWTILRRLATRDPRLNIDRAYASDTLREIEDMIENNPYSSISDLVDAWLEDHDIESKNNEAWNENPISFSTYRSVEDEALITNKGFHGVRKAMQKLSRDMSFYEPAWEKPEGV